MEGFNFPLKVFNVSIRGYWTTRKRFGQQHFTPFESTKPFYRWHVDSWASICIYRTNKEKNIGKTDHFLHLELCILQDSTSILRIFNNILFYFASIPLITILMLRICPSLCLISVGSINFSLLDNGLCSKGRYFQFASVLIFYVLYLFVLVLWHYTQQDFLAT